MCVCVLRVCGSRVGARAGRLLVVCCWWCRLTNLGAAGVVGAGLLLLVLGLVVLVLHAARAVHMILYV